MVDYSEAAETIWAYANGSWFHDGAAGVPYVRSDIAERQIAELRAERDTLAMHLEAKTILAGRDKAGKARLIEALQKVRDLFIVDYGSDPAFRPSIGYDSEALPKVIAILDAALSGSGAGGWRDAATELPPIEQVVLTRRASAYDGADIYAFGARVDDGEGWCWGEQSGYGGGIRPDKDAAWNSVEVDDEYLVTHWMPLPAAPTATGGR